MDFSPAVWAYFEQPSKAGRFAADDPEVVTGSAGSVGEGSLIRLQLRVREQVVADARFQCYGCGATIACASWTAEWVVGKTLDTVGRLHNSDIAAALQLPPQKVRSAVLAEQAVNLALSNILQT